MSIRKESFIPLNNLKQLAFRSNCHGIPDLIATNSKAQRICWAIALTCAFGAIIYYFVVITLQFIDNPTATKMTEISNSYLAFPNISICKYEKLSVKNLMKEWAKLQPIFQAVFNTTSDAVSFGGYVIGVEGPTGAEIDYSEASIIQLEQQYQFAFNTSLSQGLKLDIQDFLRTTATQCSELFNYCSFGSKAFNCCEHAYAVFTIYGVCYHLVPKPRNPQLDGPSPIQGVAGNLGGLHLELYRNATDVPIYPLTQTYQEGFFITVGSYFSIFETDTISIAAGAYGYISLNPIYRILNRKKNRCAVNQYSIGPVASGVFSYRLCQGQCYYNTTKQLFGCYILGPYLNISSSDICSPYKAGLAIQHIIDAGDPDTDAKMMDCTNYNCSQMCEFWSYPPSVMYATVIATDKYTAETKGLQITKLDVYYSQLMYTKIEQQSLMDFSAYLSGIGGNLGLFAGMSILTFVQCCAAVAFMPFEKRKIGTASLYDHSMGI